MRPMTRLVLGVVFLVGILAAVALGLPAHVTVNRSVVNNAPDTAVFSYLNTPHNFADWSPWGVRDPQLAVSYSGPETGKGAQIQWTSKAPSVGTGSMEITESNPNRHIDLAVDFNGLDGTAYYDVAPSGSGSKVTWGLSYDSGTSPLKRWKGLMLDRYLGAEFRDGLGKLKDKVESERRPVPPPPPPTATLGAPEQPGVVPGAPIPDGPTAPAPGTPEADAGAAQPSAPAVTDPAASQAATPPPPAAQPAPAQPKTPAKRPRRP